MSDKTQAAIRNFLRGMCVAMVALKLAGATSISWLLVFLPIIIPLAVAGTCLLVMGLAVKYKENLLKSNAAVLFLAILSLPVALAHASPSPQPIALPYPIVYVSIPRTGGNAAPSRVPDVADTLGYEPGTSIMLLEPGQFPRALVNGGSQGAAITPSISLDGKRMYYAFCPNITKTNAQRRYEVLADYDIYVMDLSTGTTTQLTHGAWTPREAAGPWSPTRLRSPQTLPGQYYQDYGGINVFPVEMPGQHRKIVFASNRENNELLKQGGPDTALSLYTLDLETGFIDRFWYSPTSMLEPVLLPTGEIGIHTWETGGTRDGRLWGFWAVSPHKSGFRPIYSALMSDQHSLHGCTGASNMAICTLYYQSFNYGAGVLLGAPLFPPGTPLLGPGFGSPVPGQNPAIPMGPQHIAMRFSFPPVGLRALTPSHPDDWDAGKLPTGPYTGKWAHPQALPGNQLMVAWSDGPVSKKSAITKAADFGLYTMPATDIATPDDMQLIVNDPCCNEIWGRPVVPWRDIYGAKPPVLKRPRNNGTEVPELKPGTSYALLRSATTTENGAWPGTTYPGWQAGRYTAGGTDSNMAWQGYATLPPQQAADAVEYIQIQIQTPSSHYSYGGPLAGVWSNNFFTRAKERIAFYPPIPVKKYVDGKPQFDDEGRLDTSWAAIVPAGQSYSVCALGKNYEALFCTRSWHQEAPGAKNESCVGCHLHHKDFPNKEATRAYKPGYKPVDLSKATLRTVEYWQDVSPLVQKYCVSCHGGQAPVAKLAFDDRAMVSEPNMPSMPREAALLVANRSGKLGGYPPPAPLAQQWGSRILKIDSALESPFYWAFAGGQRLDGRDNSAKPSETIQGDPSSVPVGTDYHQIDFDNTFEAQKAHAQLAIPAADVRTVAEWFNVTNPVDLNQKYGWKLDEGRPFVTITPLSTRVIVAANDDHGINWGTLVVTVDGKPVVGKLLDGERWSYPRTTGVWRVSVKDTSGNSGESVRVVREREE